jgi:hypothetical protein
VSRGKDERTRAGTYHYRSLRTRSKFRCRSRAQEGKTLTSKEDEPRTRRPMAAGRDWPSTPSFDIQLSQARAKPLWQAAFRRPRAPHQWRPPS